VSNGELAEPDRVRQVDIEDGVVAWFAICVVSRWAIWICRRLWRVPKGTPFWLEDTSAWHDDINLGESRLGRLS
jgi:hypothetical protein